MIRNGGNPFSDKIMRKQENAIVMRFNRITI
jgi:hypothetical protein